MDRGAWWGYSSWGQKESDTTKQLNNATMGMLAIFLTGLFEDGVS